MSKSETKTETQTPTVPGLETFFAKIAEIDRLRDEALNELKPKFAESFADLFAKTDRFEKVSWTQYTPSFNDGDPCSFSVNSDVKVDGEEPWDLDWYVTRYATDEEKSDPLRDWPASQIVDEFSKRIDRIPAEFLEKLFGDGVEVTLRRITRGKNKGQIVTEVENYYHD